MKITGDWLTHPGTQAVCAALEAGGHQALLVGGCVRNALIDAPVADIDIATDATPDQVIQLATAAGLKAIPTGIEHGTVTVVAKGRPHEVTTFRRDVDTDGRHATVAFSGDIREDASRRDFTMNALYARADGTVVDPLNGLPDLQARRLRFVGEPEARITEDYLRILRFFRFSAWYADPDLGPDPEALAAIATHAEGLSRISKERIGAEMRKLLAATDPAPVLATMQATGVLQQVLAGADPVAIAPLVHIEAGRKPHWLRRLAALGGENPTEALRLSRQEQKTLQQIKDAIGRSGPEVAWRFGFEVASDAALVLAASLGQPMMPEWETPLYAASKAIFPIKAANLPQDLQGPQIGQALKKLEILWIASGFAASKEELLDQL